MQILRECDTRYILSLIESLTAILRMAEAGVLVQVAQTQSTLGIAYWVQIFV